MREDTPNTPQDRGNVPVEASSRTDGAVPDVQVPESDPPSTTELRIYCICGQKMKVSPGMYGLPGKCVACRQKIRVPRPEQLSASTSEVHLKDHPQFLRKAKRPSPKAPRTKPRPEEAPDVTLGKSSDAVSVAILDILEPLRVLCSLDHKIRRQLESLSEPNASKAELEERAALDAYIERVKQARIEMDEQLRQRLMEVAIDLSGTKEKIVQAGLSARIGETDLTGFRNTANQLRRRRDGLERLQQNIRGWLTVTDPHTAGGYTNVSLDSIPSEDFQLVLPPELEDPRSPLDQHIEGLREAFLRRERAELRLHETERLEAEGNMSALVLADCHADCHAEKHRANAEVSFRRRRLEQLGVDAQNDIKTFQTCLDNARKQLKENGLDKSRFAALERVLLRAQRDCAKAHDLVNRALIATAADDVPCPKGTFLKRMAQVVDEPSPVGVGVDSWVAWASALAMGLAVFLPFVDDLSPLRAFQSLGFRGQTVHWVMVAPVIAAAFVCLIALLPRRPSRGLAYCALWLLLTMLGAILIRETQYGLSPVAVRFRQGAPWLLRPGVILLLLAHLGLLGAASVALFPAKRLRFAPAVTAALGLSVALIVFTDLGGFLLPKPTVSVVWNRQLDADEVLYDTPITIANAGGRSLLLTAPQSTTRNAFTFTLERQTGRDAWTALGLPLSVERGQRTLPRTHALNLRIGRAQGVILRYLLRPGQHRVRLQHAVGTLEPVIASFLLEEPTPVGLDLSAPNVLRGRPWVSDATNPRDAPSPAPPEPEPKREPETPTALTGVGAQLRGIITADNRDPRFLIVLHMPDGTLENRDLRIGDALYDPWVVSEFDPARQSVTIARDDHAIRILNRGQRMSLD